MQFEIFLEVCFHAKLGRFLKILYAVSHIFFGSSFKKCMIFLKVSIKEQSIPKQNVVNLW